MIELESADVAIGGAAAFTFVLAFALRAAAKAQRIKARTLGPSPRKPPALFEVLNRAPEYSPNGRVLLWLYLVVSLGSYVLIAMFAWKLAASVWQALPVA